MALAARHPDLLVPAVGIHPHHAAEVDEAAWARLEALAAEPTVGAIGEIGLDFYRMLSPEEAQRDAFTRQLDLAARLRRPVIVHDRDAHAAVREALLGWRGPGRAPRGVLHAFSGDPAMAEPLVASGFLVSFALPLAFRSAVGPRAVAGLVAEDAFLVETDAPWLGPGPGRNEPTTVLRVAAELARLRGTAPERIAASAGRTLRRLFLQAAAGADVAMHGT